MVTWFVVILYIKQYYYVLESIVENIWNIAANVRIIYVVNVDIVV